MNLLLITGTTTPRSGLGRYSAAVVQELRRQGEVVQVLSETGDRDASLAPRTGFIAFVRNLLIARARARSADTVHALDAWPFGVYAFFAVFGTKKRLVVSGVGTYSLPPAGSSLKRFLMLQMYRRTSHVLCISAYVRRRIEERLPFKVSMSVVHLATSLLPQPDKSMVQALREKYDIGVNAKVVLTVGAIKDRKGQLDTARAVLELRRHTSNLVYVIIGDDHDRSYVQQIREVAEIDTDALRLLNNVSSDAELAAWYSLADAFALASNNEGDHFEGFGLVFLEAYQFGVPGIGSRNCGIEDAIRDGVTGYLCNQRDPEDIARKIALALEKPKVSYAAPIQQFLGEFSWRKTAESYVSCYKDCK